MKLRDTKVVLLRHCSWVQAGPHPDTTGWSEGWEDVGGACEPDWHDLSPEQQQLRLLGLFAALIVRDGVLPEEAHTVFVAIDEYRAALPADVPMPEPRPIVPRIDSLDDFAALFGRL